MGKGWPCNLQEGIGVALAELVMLLVVIQAHAGSSPAGHPNTLLSFSTPKSVVALLIRRNQWFLSSDGLNETKKILVV